MGHREASSANVGILAYATPVVRTAPPRSFLRLFAAAIARGIGLLLTSLRLSILGLGYVMLGAGIALRFGFGIIAMCLLFTGGVRWSTVKTRTLRAADWVDRKTLQTLRMFARILPANLRRGI